MLKFYTELAAFRLKFQTKLERRNQIERRNSVGLLFPESKYDEIQELSFSIKHKMIMMLSSLML